MSQNNCKQEAGIVEPVIDRNRCEGKADCVAVCPVGVFAVETLPKAEREQLSFRGKVKGFFHGWQQAILVNPDACEACGLCVQSCPEKAITLLKRSNVDASPAV